MRDILAALGCRGAIFQNGSGASLQFLARFALREFKKREIRALLLDEADTWSEETLGGVVTLFDLCREEGSPLTLILVGVNDPEQWMGGAGAGRSRTLRVEAARALDGPTMLGVMAAWAPGPLRPLAERVGAGDKEARRLLRLLHRGLGGNLRRCRFFCDLLPLVAAEDGGAGEGLEFNEALMNHVMARMTLPGLVGPAPAARR